MTGSEWDGLIDRMGGWWSLGLDTLAEVHLFDEFYRVSSDRFAEALDSFVAEGRERAPSPSAFFVRLSELAPPMLLPPPEFCSHAEKPYPLGFETPSRPGVLVEAWCLDCGETFRLPLSAIRTRGQDEAEDIRVAEKRRPNRV